MNSIFFAPEKHIITTLKPNNTLNTKVEKFSIIWNNFTYYKWKVYFFNEQIPDSTYITTTLMTPVYGAKKKLGTIEVIDSYSLLYFYKNKNQMEEIVKPEWFFIEYYTSAGFAVLRADTDYGHGILFPYESEARVHIGKKPISMTLLDETIFTSYKDLTS